MIEIKEVNTKSDIKKFATYPLKLYKDCPYYVPSLRSDELNTFNPKKNFNLKDNICKGFLCYKDGELVGRIAGMVNKVENNKSDKKWVRFSRIECIDDIEVFKALFNAVEVFGKENGAEYIHGPWGFLDQDREGLLTYGFNERATYATNYYYPYFADNIRKLGFSDESKWDERRFIIPEKVYEKVDRLAEKIKNKFKLVDVADLYSVKGVLSRYGDKLFEALNEAYGKLDGYVPVEGKSKDIVLKQFATIVNIRYVSILVDEEGDVVSFAIVLPSICDTLIKHKGKLFPTGFIGVLRDIAKPKQLEMALIGVKDKYRNMGLNAIMISKILKNMIEDKIELIESNPMLETNLDVQQMWNFSENEIVKKRQTFQKKIEL